MKIGNLKINGIYTNEKKDIVSQKKDDTIKKLSDNDDLSISNDAEKLHRLALNSNEVLNTIDKFKSNELQEIKNKISSGYYEREGVIENIASSVLEDDEFKQLFMKDEMLEVVEDYIDAKEVNLEKVNQSKINLAENSYQKTEVYESVADNIINVYT